MSKTKKSTTNYNPYTPSRRFMTKEDFSDITKSTPEKSLTFYIKERAGRDNTGRISVHHKGGGAKKKYRIISSLQEKLDMPATVASIEYDPYRTSRIMLVRFEDGAKMYLIAPEGIKVGQTIIAKEDAKITLGNRAKLKNIPTGTEIYDVETQPNSKGRMVRSAGASAMVLAQAEGEGKRAKYIQVKMPSGEVRLLHKENFASIGKVGNIAHGTVKIGKAGRSRWLGIRPTVRGKVKNPVDHPHGGGEGKNPIGLKYPKTPWGKPARGVRTRKNKRTNKFIIKRRKK